LFITPQDNDIDNNILSQPPCSVLIWFSTLYGAYVALSLAVMVITFKNTPEVSLTNFIRAVEGVYQSSVITPFSTVDALLSPYNSDTGNTGWWEFISCFAYLRTCRLALEARQIWSEVLWDSASVSRQTRLLLFDPSNWWAPWLLASELLFI